MGKERDEREADIAARAVEPRQAIDLKTLPTSVLITMLNPEICAIVLWGEDGEHMPDETAGKAELERVIVKVAAEVDRRIPIPEGT